jgi:hypothetical protein
LENKIGNAINAKENWWRMVLILIIKMEIGPTTDFLTAKFFVSHVIGVNTQNNRHVSMRRRQDRRPHREKLDLLKAATNMTTIVTKVRTVRGQMSTV